MTKLIYHLLCWVVILEKWGKHYLTLSGASVLIMLIFTLVIGLDTRQSKAYQIAMFLLFVIFLAVLASRFGKIPISITRTLPRFASVGIPLSYRVTLENKTHKTQRDLKIREIISDLRPTYLEFYQAVKNSSKRSNYLLKHWQQWNRLIKKKQLIKTKVIALPILPPHSKTEIKLEIIPLHRGQVNLQGLILTRADPLGLFNQLKRFVLRDSCYILPTRYPIPPIPLSGSRKYQSGGISLASSVGDSEEFMALREYRPGDPLRKIHWRSWAKVGKIIVREEEDEFFVRHALILDTFASENEDEALEEAISVAASFACQVQTQDSLLDLMFIGTQAYCFTSGRSIGYTEEMLEILASVSACIDQSFESLNALVLSRIHLLSGCICIFLKWDQSRQTLVNYLRRLRLPTLVLVVVKDDSLIPKDDNGKEQLAEKIHYLRLGQIPEDLFKL
ncbi:MAG: DUF58 domain-containing protein [Microcystaceae cyanobacterium]